MSPDDTAAGQRQTGSSQASRLLEPGETCWRVAQANAISFIVDAEPYFRVLRQIFLSTEKELLLIGWDFDFEIEMLPGESDDQGRAPDGYPNRLGPFIDAVVKSKPDLRAYLLKWNGAVLAAPGAIMPSLALDIFGSDRIHFALDGHHPFGACHHQKIVVADGSFAFCGGIDMTEERWDTSEHAPDNPLRMRTDGTLSGPWHDATMAISGKAAAALGELARMRWQRATGETLSPPEDVRDIDWPAALDRHASDLAVGIARTEPPYDGDPLVNEIEQLYLRSIEAATTRIYIESQYFAARTICDALAARLREVGGPEIVVINPVAARAQLEDDAMHVLRGRMIERLSACDHEDRFRIFYPVNAAEEAIYVHAKILIVDDTFLRLGSSNINNRSMGFDTECDVAIAGDLEVIAAARGRLLAEHLNVSPETFERAFAEEGTMIAAIERLNASEGRGLRRVVPEEETWMGTFLANTRALDPRYRTGDTVVAGRGLRPRHLAIGAGLAVLGYLGWKALTARR